MQFILNSLKSAKIPELTKFFFKDRGWLPGIALIGTTTVSSILTIVAVLIALLVGVGSISFTEGWMLPVIIGVVFGSILTTIINSFAYSGVLSSYVDIIKDQEKPTISKIIKTSFTSFFPVFWASMIQLVLVGILIVALYFIVPPLYSIHWAISVLVSFVIFFFVILAIIFSLLIIPTVFISTVDKRPIRMMFKMYKTNMKSIMWFTLYTCLMFLIPIQGITMFVFLAVLPAYTLMLYFETIKNDNIVNN